MLYKEVPFLKITLPLVAGILAGSSPWNLDHFVLLLCTFIATLIIYFISRKSKNGLLSGIFLTFFFFSVGYSLYQLSYYRITATHIKEGRYLIMLNDYPAQKQSSIKIDALLCRYDTLPSGNHTKLLLYFPVRQEILEWQPGDIIKIDLSPREISDFNTDDNFNYSKYMLYRGYKYSDYISRYSDTGTSRTNTRLIALKFRKLLLEKYEKGINSVRAVALASALTLGYRDSLDEDTRNSFRDAGISHIMAVSGLHTGIICIIITWFTGILGIRNRYAAIIILLGGIWLFALVTGLSPSVSRAALMFSFLYTGKLSGRNVNPLNSLLASAFVLLVIKPFLIFAAGFQLSYSAVLFILLFFRQINGLINFTGALLSGAWSLISVSILAQLGALPLVLAHFRQIPLLSLITNLLAIPLAFLILISGLLFLIIPGDFFISDILARLIEIEVYILFSVADWIASIPHSVISI